MAGLERRYVDGKWQTVADDDGGSLLGAVRLADLGVFDASVNGIESAYETAVGETVLAVLLSDCVGANEQTLVFGTDEMIAGITANENVVGPPRPLAYLSSTDDSYDSFGLMEEQSPKQLMLVSDAVKVGIYVSPGFISGDRNWEANHIYPAGSYVVALVDQGAGLVNTIYHTAAGGTSGATEPTWTINPVDTDDGTVTWHDAAVLDETLSCHAYALVAAA